VKSDFLIISVESRKGGVGKTTAALNLARSLLERRERAVLFLDVDITGTNATDCIDSPFWKDTCHAVRDIIKGETRVANLLANFEERFMPGLGMPRFVTNGSHTADINDTALLCAADKVNIFGSQMYDLTDHSHRASGTFICKPSVLFDELHSFWFIEFLQRTCEAFIDAIRKDEPKRAVAVIIDNSPGYVGIAPAVQEWLTDLGPDRGKFLTVASLDKQDVLSCANAVHNLHQLYTRKWMISRKYAQAIGKESSSGTTVELTREEEGFFVRLIENQPLGDISPRSSRRAADVSADNLSFYSSGEPERGERHLSRPEGYQALILNRVPRLIKRGLYRYDTEHVYSLMSDVVQRLLGGERSNYARWMVSFDESIEYQFLQPMLSRRGGRLSRRKRRLEDFIHTIQDRHGLPPSEPLDGMLQSGESPRLEMLHEVQMYLRTTHEKVVDVLRLVEQSGFSHLTRLIDEEWLPGSILRDFRISMQDVLLEMDEPFVEFGSWELIDEQVGPESLMFFEEFRHSARVCMERHGVAVPDSLADQFLSSLAILVALSMGPRRRHLARSPEFPELLGSIAAIEVQHWMRHRKQSRERRGIQRFLAGECLLEREWRGEHDELHIHPRWFERGLLPHFYGACASAQARLIDVRRDAEFLILLIQRLVMEDIHDAPVLPYVRGIATKVIVRKTMSHESGQEQLHRGLSSVQYMDEFSEVLERVLAGWEVWE
jgi:DNA polymerase III delta prime subunit